MSEDHGRMLQYMQRFLASGRLVSAAREGEPMQTYETGAAIATALTEWAADGDEVTVVAMGIFHNGRVDTRGARSAVCTPGDLRELGAALAVAV